MPITPLPELDRTSSTFKQDCNDFFGTELPAFSVEAEAARVQIVAAESTATTAASTATTQAGIATTAAGTATTKAADAETARAAAVVAKNAAEAALDSFDDRYLGPKASNPTTDNDGNALVTGALYFNTTAGEMRVWSGAAWAAAYLPASGYATLTGSETLTNKTLTSPAINTPTITGYTETVYALSGTVIDPANGTVQTKTLSGNTTFTESIADGQSVVLMLNPATYTTTWPTTSWVNAAGSGAAPTLKASVVNVVVLWQVGGTLYGNWIGSM